MTKCGGFCCQTRPIFRKNTGCLSRKIGEVWRQKTRWLGVLTIFKQALTKTGNSGCLRSRLPESPIATGRQACRLVKNLYIFSVLLTGCGSELGPGAQPGSICACLIRYPWVCSFSTSTRSSCRSSSINVTIYLCFTFHHPMILYHILYAYITSIY